MNQRIEKLIKALDIKRVDFAKQLKISPSFVSDMCSGKGKPSDRTILDICQKFSVSERWLRTGEGEMFIPKDDGDEISSFIGDILAGEPDFRRRFISVLSRMTSEEWRILEKKVIELSEEMKRADP